jgi:N-acetylglucosamine kinase-like BadF-type ATPase
MTLLIGVDAGASRSAAFVADERLAVLARAAGAPGAIAADRVTEAAAAVVATARAALAGAGADHARALVVGAAGAGREPERGDLEHALVEAGVADRVRVTTDIEIALLAAFSDGPGILLLAGTGSGACARLPSGETHRTGGHGWQFGDEGSGYALARAALAAIARADDGRGPATALTAGVVRAAGVGATASELLTWARTAPRASVADLARVVQEAAAEGDPPAEELVEQAARDLVAHVRALLARFPGDGPVPVALAGGLFAGRQPVHRAVMRLLKAAPRVQVNETVVEPPCGALLLASRLA